MRLFLASCADAPGEFAIEKVTGPDFLCVGLQKAGTGWLFDQLQHHPDFWMPPVKEFHYFDRDFPDDKLSKILDLARRAPTQLEKKRQRSNWRPLSDLDRAFFRDAEACRGNRGDLAQYARLFAYKGELKSGDITPAYCALADSKIEEIMRYFPELRIVLLLRDPVARAWSQISMSFRRGKFDRTWLDDRDEFMAFLNSEQVAIRSFPTQIFARWRKHVRPERMCHCFFDDIESEPGKVREKILLFLGGDPAKQSAELGPDFNRKADQKKLQLTESVNAMLVEHFADEIRACGMLFGGRANEWVARYGL